MFITTLSPNPLQLTELMQVQNLNESNVSNTNNSNSSSTMSWNNITSSQDRDRMSLDQNQSGNTPFSISAQSLDRLQHLLQDLQEEFENQLDLFEEKEQRVRRYKSQILASDFQDKYKEQLSPQNSTRKSNPNVQPLAASQVQNKSKEQLSQQNSAPERKYNEQVQVQASSPSSNSKSSENVQNTKSHIHPRPATMAAIVTDHTKYKPEQYTILDDLTKELMSKFNKTDNDKKDEDENEKKRHGHGNSNSNRPATVSSSTQQQEQDLDEVDSELSPVIHSPLVKVGAGSPRQEIRRSMVEKWKEIKELEKELEYNRDHLQKRFTQIQKLEDEIENMNSYLKKSRALGGDNSVYQQDPYPYPYHPHNSSNSNEFNLTVASHEEDDRSSECESSHTGLSQSENHPVSPAKVQVQPQSQTQFSADPRSVEESNNSYSNSPSFSPSASDRLLLAGETGTSKKITMTPSGSNTRDERNLEENKSSPALDDDSLKITRLGWLSCFAFNFTVLAITIVILVVTAVRPPEGS